MLDGRMDQADGAAAARGLALARTSATRSVTVPAGGDPVADWRDDLRLFGYAWAAGFIFFMVMLA